MLVTVKILSVMNVIQITEKLYNGMYSKIIRINKITVMN